MDQRDREGAGNLTRVMVCGSREGFSEKHVWEVLAYLLECYPSENLLLIHGAARGVDTFADRWAEACRVMRQPHPADWEKHGKAAGYVRNKTMVDEADTVVAFWNGKSKGTYHSINLALEGRKELHIYYPEEA